MTQQTDNTPIPDAELAELDGTDAAHPAWWRGNDAGVSQVCAKINAILDGADVSGTASEPWESTRRRLAEARKDSERLATAGQAVVDRWDSPKWKDQDPTAKVINELRAAIDAARGRK